MRMLTGKLKRIKNWFGQYSWYYEYDKKRLINYSKRDKGNKPVDSIRKKIRRKSREINMKKKPKKKIII